MRVGGQRTPRAWRTAQRRDELAPFQPIELHAVPPACTGLEDTDFEAVSQRARQPFCNRAHCTREARSG
jgi:hypothetical protein